MKDRVVVITGGRGNLGRAVASAFAAADARVAVIDHGTVPETVTDTERFCRSVESTLRNSHMPNGQCKPSSRSSAALTCW